MRYFTDIISYLLFHKWHVLYIAAAMVAITIIFVVSLRLFVAMKARLHKTLMKQKQVHMNGYYKKKREDLEERMRRVEDLKNRFASENDCEG